MRFLQYVCQKSLLRQYGNAKLQKLFQPPLFAVLNLPKRMNKLPVSLVFYGLETCVKNALVHDEGGCLIL